MQQTLRERYDAVPYRHGSIPDSHPARVAAIARLHGIPAAAPDRCRVLELGCAEGMNLLPLAERFPRSQFVGIDFSPVQIGAAEEARVACGLENVRFVCADLRDFEPEAEGFDYVIAHGVYSWVADDLKDRLLALVSRALAPNGAGYVSYNTLPGWATLAGLRQFLLGETSHFAEPREQIEHALRVLGALRQSLENQPGAHAAQMRLWVGEMLAKDPALLFHDELALVNDPCTFTEFVGHAAAHRLQFLAEGHYLTQPFAHVPEPMRAPLAALELDFVRQQQFMDVLFPRVLRNTLLCRADAQPRREVDASVIAQCAVGLRLRPAESRVDLRAGVPMRWLGANDLALDFSRPGEKALLAVLAQSAPSRVAFSQALEATNAMLTRIGLPPADAAEMCALLFRIFALDGLDLMALGEGVWLLTRQPPAASELMRFQARTGRAVVNRWHEIVSVTAEGRAWLSDPASVPNDGAARAGFLV